MSSTSDHDHDPGQLAARLLDATSLVVFAKDLQDRHTYVNRAGAARVGLEVDEIVGRTDTELYGREVAAHFRDAVEAALAAPEGSTRLEVDIPVVDGSGRHIATIDTIRDANGEATGVVGILVDVSVRAETERLLRERTRQLAVAQRVAQIGDWSWDPGTDAPRIGPELNRLLGVASDTEWDLAGLAALVHPQDKGPTIRALVAVTEGIPADHVFRVHLGHERTERWFHLRTEPPELEHQVVGTVQDITDQVRAEQERAELERRLHRTQRLDSVGRLAGGIAHDFNNLLAVMRIEAELAQHELRADHPATVHVGALHDAVDRAAALTRQLLVFSRHDHQDVGPVDLAAVVGGLQGMLDRTIGDDVTLTCDLASPLPAVLADPTQLEQVLVNLVVNARDAMPAGGRLEITARAVDATAPDQPTELLGTPTVRLEVADTGNGMSAQVLAQVFEPFFTTKGPDQGTGLGLTTVQTLVHRWGGAVTIRSDPDRGTRVSVHLVVADAPGPDAEVGIDADETRRGTPEAATVLVVEDLETLGRLAVSVLARAGHRAVLAGDGEQALSFVAEGFEPDLVLTDVVMPGLSGGELAQRLRDQRPELPVVFMSGYSAGMLESTIGDLDGTILLAKPFTSDELLDAVRRALPNHG